MALFTDTRELDRQGRHRNFRGVTGIKKEALMMLGYNADGTKNKFGQIAGHGNVLMDHYVPKMVAGKDSDTGKVIDAAESEEWNKQMATAKLAMNFVGGGMTGGSGGGESGGGAMGALGGMFGGGGDKSSETPNADAMAKVDADANKNAAMDKLNSGYSEQTIDGVTTTTIDGVALDPESLSKYNSYMEENPEGTVQEFKTLQDEEEEGKGLVKAADSTEAIPILGDLMGAVASRVPIDNALNAKKKEIERQSSTQNFNYL